VLLKYEITIKPKEGKWLVRAIARPKVTANVRVRFVRAAFRRLARGRTAPAFVNPLAGETPALRLHHAAPYAVLLQGVHQAYPDVHSKARGDLY
jgi:hypothetical protein